MAQTIDFGAAIALAAEATGVSYELVPAGKYNATIDKSEVKPAKSGAAMLYCELVIVDEGPFKGKKLFHNFVLPEPGAEKAAERWQYFFNDMAVLGIPKDWFVQVGATDLDNVANILVGRSANVEVKHTVSDGTTYANIKRWRAFSTAPVIGGVPPVPGAPTPGAVPQPPVVAAPVPQAPAAPAAPAAVPAPPAAPAAPPAPPAAPLPPAAPAAPASIPAPPPPPFAA